MRKKKEVEQENETENETENEKPFVAFLEYRNTICTKSGFVLRPYAKYLKVNSESLVKVNSPKKSPKAFLDE